MSEDEYLRPAPTIIPPMTAATWLTMDESLFRSLVLSGAVALVGTDALNAIRERCDLLGVERP